MSSESDASLLEPNYGIDLDTEIQREYDFLIINQSNRKSSETLSHSSSILSRILEDEILKEWLDNCGDRESDEKEREPTPMTIVELNSDDTISVASDNDVANIRDDFAKDDTTETESLIITEKENDSVNSKHEERPSDTARTNAVLDNMQNPNQNQNMHDENLSQVKKHDSPAETAIPQESPLDCSTSVILQAQDAKITEKKSHRRKNKHSPMHLLREITSLESTPLGNDQASEANNGK